MNKAERSELRAIIRRRLKVLRSDIEARRRELYAKVDADLEVEYLTDLKRWDDAQTVIGLAVDEANRKVNDVYRDYFGKERWGQKADRKVVGAVAIGGPDKDRTTERRRRCAQADALVAAAFIELDRKEADILEELSIGALESADAREFMARIPSVAELVPAARLAELTANVTDENDPR